MPIKTDVLVVGAGTGGSTAAYALARKGIGVVLVDRKPRENIGRKVCGDGIPKATFDNLKKLIGLEHPKGEEIKMAAKGMDLIGPNFTEKYRLTSPNEEGYIVDRHKFGQRLLMNAMDVGADLYPNTHIKDVTINDSVVCGVSGSKEGEKMGFEASVVIDATGSSAVLLKRLPASLRGNMEEGYSRKDIGFAYREIRDLEQEIDDPDFIKIYYSHSRFPGGYYWEFPRGAKSVNAGLGVMPVGNYPSPKTVFRAYIKTNDLYKDSTIIHAGSGYVPLRRPNDVLVANGFILVGDSGSMVNPIHGGGIGPSMDAGAFAAETIEVALENNDMSTRSLWSYSAKFQREIGSRYAALELFKWLLITLNDFQLSTAMRNKIITDEDIENIGNKKRIELNNIEKIRRLWRGKRIPRIILRLIKTSRRMQAIGAHYLNYPEEPDEFKPWKEYLKKLQHGYIPDKV
ncbi:MAG: geranylgeranyl reductase family protein [Promethearchaeota archaeon]